MASSDWVRTMPLPSRISRLTMYRSTLEMRLGASRTLASSQIEARLIMDDELRRPMIEAVRRMLPLLVEVAAAPATRANAGDDDEGRRQRCCCCWGMPLLLLLPLLTLEASLHVSLLLALPSLWKTSANSPPATIPSKRALL